MTQDRSTKPRVSVVIKAKNEERRLPAALRSCRNFADEIIVVDDSSTDATRSIAENLGAVVVSARSRDGVINELDVIGFEASTGTHICRLDADERMQPGLAKALLELAVREDVQGVAFARMNVMFGDWPKHGGWHVADQLRFFRADAWDRNWHFADIHSQVPVHGRVMTLDATPALSTLHEDYDSLLQFVNRSFARYARSEAKDRLARGERSTTWTLLWRPLRRLLGRLIIRQGFRDGYRGVLLAILLGIYEALVEGYMWDESRDLHSSTSS